MKHLIFLSTLFFFSHAIAEPCTNAWTQQNTEHIEKYKTDLEDLILQNIKLVFFKEKLDDSQIEMNVVITPGEIIDRKIYNSVNATLIVHFQNRQIQFNIAPQKELVKNGSMFTEIELNNKVEYNNIGDILSYTCTSSLTTMAKSLEGDRPFYKYDILRTETGYRVSFFDAPWPQTLETNIKP